MKTCLTCIFLAFLSGTYGFAQVNPLLKCLGLEEQKLHASKNTGPIYHLNQRLIGRFINITAINIKAKFIKQVCSSQQYTPSVALLHLLLLKKSKIFNLPRDKAITSQYERSSIQELVGEIPRIFIRYLIDLQGQTPIAGCLKRSIPEVQLLLSRYQNLQDVTSTQFIFYNKNLVSKIFSKMKNFDQFFESCLKLKEKRQKQATSK